MLNGMTNGLFKPLPQGGSVFYPWGFLGRGYVLDSAEREQHLRRQIRSWYATGLALSPLAYLLPHFLSLAAGAAVIGMAVLGYTVGYMAWVTRTTADLGQTYGLRGSAS